MLVESGGLYQVGVVPDHAPFILACGLATAMTVRIKRKHSDALLGSSREDCG
jgi:hypothetical protein